jgi:hypothetical protein
VDNAEARALLIKHLQSYRERAYAELVALIGDVQVAQLAGAGGVEYQVEVDFLWDGRTGENIRVIGSIDDGGWRAFLPLCDSFIMAPDGTFIGE